MRVVFMGTPEFAVPSLRALSASHDVVAVVTRPDAVSKRGGAAVPSPVRSAAEALGIPVLTPTTLRDPEVTAALLGTSCDVIVVTAYGALLPQEVLDIPVRGCLNVHASLLPRWRGAAPVQRAILAGDEVTGVCITLMGPGLDTGPVSRCREVAVGRHGAAELTSLLAEQGAEALLEALEAIGRGAEVWVAQDETRATYADKVTRGDVSIGSAMTVGEADRRVRASSTSAPCRVSIGGHSVTVLEARPATAPVAPGKVTVVPQLALGMADGALALDRIRPDGKGSMPAASWLNGARIAEGADWGPA